MHSDAWCPMPFLSLTIHPTNKLTTCMMSNTDMGNPYNDGGWDNSKFQKIRQNMLDGVWSLETKIPTTDDTGVWTLDNLITLYSENSPRKPLPSTSYKIETPGNCSTCLLRELNGLQSQRNNWIDDRAHIYPTGTYENANKLTGNKILHLNLNLSNICNFKCRMCGPTYSNAWIPDHNFLAENKLPHLYINDYDKLKQIINFDNFFEKYGSSLDNLKSIWVTGGEPFMDDRLIDFVNTLSNYCDISKLDINITTNGSKIDLNKLSAFEKVGRVGYNLSIDAVGPLFEYMRSAGVFSWNELETLIKDLIYYRKNNNNMILNYNSSYQIYNSLNIKNFYEYFVPLLEDGDWLEYRLVTSPSWLVARNANDQIKKAALSNIDELLSSNILNKRNAAHVNNCKNMINKPRDNEEWGKFLKFTGALDHKRKQYLKEYSPEIYSLLTTTDIEILENAAVS